jgi:imidazolonepropionase-like amidohydrolase
VTARPGGLLFEDVRLIDGIAPDARQHMDVLVIGDRIAALETADPAARDSTLQTYLAQGVDVRRVPGAGRTLLPGLIDCHAHYLLDATAPTMFESEERDPDSLVVLRGARAARQALAAGITTARSAGAPRALDIPLAAAIDTGDVPGPRIIPAGRALTITGGHGWRFGVQADGELALRAAVRANVRDGARVIKAVASEAAMLTTGVAGVQELTEDELRAIVAEAARLRCRVLAHAQSNDAVRAAARAGVASVEHAFLADEPTLEILAASGATLVPTLSVTDIWRTLPGLSDAQRQRQTIIEGLHRRSCETAVRLRIPMATGTDTGVRGVLPGMVAREIRLLHEHGLGAMDAIHAGTSNAARLLGVDDETGSITLGRRADLLLVDGDPLSDLDRLASPAMVVQAGAVRHLVTPAEPG